MSPSKGLQKSAPKGAFVQSSLASSITTPSSSLRGDESLCSSDVAIPGARIEIYSQGIEIAASFGLRPQLLAMTIALKFSVDL